MSVIKKIDGSFGEGGGQVLRIALTLSALYKIPIIIENIRAGRPKPGLAAQHLKGVEIARDMCNARVNGAHLGSTHLEFQPGTSDSKKREFYADTKTAGCICLLAQIAIPLALFSPPGKPISLILKGGTNVPMGPQIEYLTEVFRPWLRKFGGNFDFSIIKRGYYPQGGGEVHLYVTPVENLHGIEMLSLGAVPNIVGWAYAAGSVHLDDAYCMAEAAKKKITEKLQAKNVPIPSIIIKVYREDGFVRGNGSGINLVCETSDGSILGGSGLGSNRQGSKAEPGVEAAEQIVRPLVNNSCVDEHMQDQLVILMAIARGQSRVSIGMDNLTGHTETAVKIAEMMLEEQNLRFNVVSKDGNERVLECEGCGLINKG